MTTEDTSDYTTWPRPRRLRRIALTVFIWLWAIAWSVGLAFFLAGCGSDNLLAEGHYRTAIHWTHSDWSGTALPPDDIQVWTITGDDEHYKLVLPGSDSIVHGYEAKNAAVFTLGVKATQPGDLSPFLKVVLQRQVSDSNDAYTGHGEACAWIGYALMCERVDVNSTDFAEID